MNSKILVPQSGTMQFLLFIIAVKKLGCLNQLKYYTSILIGINLPGN